MLQRLRELGLGAHVAGLYMGTVCYADDLLLIAPTRSAMQRMLVEIEDFAAEYNITFSTDPVPSKSKTKCLFIVGNRRHLRKPASLVLCVRELPYVRQAEHLGNMLTEEGTMEQDTVMKRARFIQSSVEIRTLFSFAAPAEVLHALKVYSSSFYGSCLWDLGGMKAKQVYSAWNTTVKLVWYCPLWTRTFFLQQLLSCGQTSAKVDILTRYVNFFHSLRSSACHEVQILSRYLARDVQSVTGRNLRLIHDLSLLNPWTAKLGHIRQALILSELVEVPEMDRWRLPYLCSLLTKRREMRTLALENEENYISDLISSLVRN